jgi:DNA-directed RNA polymerase III subunit RPC6
MPPPPFVASRKRPAASSVSAGGGSKKIRAGYAHVKQEDSFAAAFADAPATSTAETTTTKGGNIKERFLQVFSNAEYKNGISNSVLKEFFGETEYIALAPVINELIGQSRLTMSKIAGRGELFYQLVSSEVAQQFQGLDVSARMVYQVIERAGNMGIWTKDIKIQTNIQLQALNKVFKALESRQLIKPVKSVAAKSKKLYMLYNLTPSKELTGGVWYSDLEFDHEFISELRSFLLQCVRRLNGGKGVTLPEILEKMVQAKISRVELTTVEVSQLVNTLVFDYMVEEGGHTEAGDALYIAARRVTPMCEFAWWDALEPDFQYRRIRFQDGVELSAHEPHYHTA